MIVTAETYQIITAIIAVVEIICKHGEVSPDTANVAAFVAHVYGAAGEQLDEDNLVAAKQKYVRKNMAAKSFRTWDWMLPWP